MTTVETSLPSTQQQTPEPRQRSPHPLRVLYVDSSVGFGGAVRSMSLLWKGLPNVSPLLFTAQESGIVRQWYGGAEVRRYRRFANYRTLAELRRRSRIVAKSMAVASELARARYRRSMRQLIRRAPVDLVHLNNGIPPSEAVIAARDAGIPSVVHVRGFFRGPVRDRDEVTHWIVVSQAAREALVKCGVPESRTSVVYNPVDASRFDGSEGQRTELRHDVGLPSDGIAVGIFGRVVEWKGHLAFTRAMLHAMDREPRLWAVVVGDESDGGRRYFDEVRSMARQSEHAERFVFAGYQPRVEPYYNAVDVVAHTSIEPEPSSRTIVEGMAAGRPIVASPLGGGPEVVTEGVDGYLRDPEDPDGLASAFIDLARDSERRRSMGERGRQAVRERYSLPQIGREVREIYDRLIAEGRAGGL